MYSYQVKPIFLIRKVRVQNNRAAAFQFIKLIFVIQKLRVRNRRCCFLGYYVTFCNMKNACSKQAVAAFQVTKLLFVIKIKQEAAFQFINY